MSPTFEAPTRGAPTAAPSLVAAVTGNGPADGAYAGATGGTWAWAAATGDADDVRGWRAPLSGAAAADVVGVAGPPGRFTGATVSGIRRA